MTDLRTAAQQALEALEGWENHDRWVWPESALEQAKRNTTESLAALRAALAQQPEPRNQCGETCERAKLCATCAQVLAQQAEPVEPVQEPVAWMESPHGAIRANPLYKHTFPSQLLHWQIPLYTAPPQRLPLTEEEIDKIFNHLRNTVGASCKTMARAVERALSTGVSMTTQEPIAWLVYTEDGASSYVTDNPTDLKEGQSAYALFPGPFEQILLTEEEIDAATAQERDALLDHIYEYGTAAEGVLERIRKLCRAVEKASWEKNHG